MPDPTTAMMQVVAVMAMLGLVIACWIFCHVSGRSGPHHSSDHSEGES